MSELLFEPLRLKGAVIQNRFAAQAMEGNDGGADGGPSERTVARYQNLARGRWGLVVVEAISVCETSRARVNGMFIKRDNLDGFKRLTETFKKEYPQGILLFQLTHSGEQSGGFSDRTTVTPNAEGRYLSCGEIERIKESFVNAALLAEEAGADGIDFKMCHGYLGGEILRPRNTRPDKWGGSFENRVRLLREGVGEIRTRLKTKGFILGSRLSLYEGIRGGCGTGAPDELIENLSEMLGVIRIMGDLGMDYVNVSAGIPALTGPITRPTEPSKHLALHHLRYAGTVKQTLSRENRPLRVIGSAYSVYKDGAPLVMEESLAKGYADVCGFGRQTFADPLTPRKIAEHEEVDWCVLCSGCSKLMAAQRNDGCIVYNDYYKNLIKQQH
jgi:2,4-dienoyl-CoA reductase-like NADH-dependent reductase (Old Yellow Enzyme family)